MTIAVPVSWHIGSTLPAAMLAFFSRSSATKRSLAEASGSSRIAAQLRPGGPGAADARSRQRPGAASRVSASRRHLDHALAVEIGRADIIAGQFAIGRVVLAQRKQLVKGQFAHQCAPDAVPPQHRFFRGGVKRRGGAVDGAGPGADIKARVPMTQNIYDDDAFLPATADCPARSRARTAPPEWPALRAMLPDLRGKRVVDLGCGFGWFCRWAREQGAARVLGLDVSEKMLARARGGDRRSGRSSMTGPTWNGSTCRLRRSTSPTVRWPSTTSKTSTA